MRSPDLYVHVHKGLRSLISQALYEAGSTDWMDASAVDRVQAQWQVALQLLHSHHHHETDFIHPMLAKAVPGGQRAFEAEHNAQGVILDDLDGHLRRLSGGQMAAERRQETGLEFYRGLAMFYAEYAPHLHREEEWAQRTIEALYTPEEMASALGQTIASIPPEEAALYLSYMIPAMSLPDCENFLSDVKASTPPEMRDAIIGVVRQHRSDEDWATLESRLGMQASG